MQGHWVRVRENALHESAEAVGIKPKFAAYMLVPTKQLAVRRPVDSLQGRVTAIKLYPPPNEDS